MKIEKYSEDLQKYAGLIHEACEGRYDLTLYDLNVLEAAIDELIELKHKLNELE